MTSPLRVCFVAVHSYPVMNPDAPGEFGGTETRAWTFAKQLAKDTRFAVSFVVLNETLTEETIIEGVKMIPMPYEWGRNDQRVLLNLAKTKQFPWVSAKKWSLSLLWRAPICFADRAIRGGADYTLPVPFFQKIKADIFLTFSVQCRSAQVIASALPDNRPAVLCVGSDGDLDERYVLPSDYISPYGDRASDCSYILKQASRIIVQTDSQKEKLDKFFQRESHLVRNPIDLATWKPLEKEDSRREYVLWIGRAESVHKRPHLCNDLAKQCPDISFLMVLNPKDADYEAAVRADAPSNVKIVQSIPFHEMPAVMQKAAAFVSTSSLEGFPNVFLQALACGVPVASLAVGKEFFEQVPHSFFADGDLDSLSQYLNEIWSSHHASSEQFLQNQKQAIDYLKSHYSVQETANQLATHLLDAASSVRDS